MSIKSSMTIEELILSGVVREFKGAVVDSSTDTSLPLVLLNPKSRTIEVAPSVSVRLIVACTQSSQGGVELFLAENSSVEMVNLYLADSYVNFTVHQSLGSQCKTMTALLSSTNVTYNYLLEGEYCSNAFDGLFMAMGSDHATLNLTTRHLKANCNSNSTVKGVSAGRATGEFHGLVYVAPDAQHTDAQQQNRNIELDDSHIVALPQLEIYADDVRCSHGSTVGYSDEQAIFYMRQRGLTESYARRLQIEGFVGEVVNRCNMEEICCFVRDIVSQKMSEI